MLDIDKPILTLGLTLLKLNSTVLYTELGLALVYLSLSSIILHTHIANSSFNFKVNTTKL